MIALKMIKKERHSRPYSRTCGFFENDHEKKNAYRRP